MIWESSLSTEPRVELTRYFCLSATRNRQYDEAEACIQLLDNVAATKSMAAFLRADLLEHKKEFVSAITEYEKSIELNKGKDSRLERTYRPLIRCILMSPQPDYSLAEKYALDWIRLRKTIFSLMALARVYLRWKHLGRQHKREVPADIDKRYVEALAVLEREPGVGSAHFELKAEEAELSSNFKDALDYMDRAINADPRFELRVERWRLMARAGTSMAEQVLDELHSARNNLEYRSNWRPFLPNLAETYALALKNLSRGFGGVNTFASELTNKEIGVIVARVKRS